MFELLDTVEYGGDIYQLITPYYETKEEYDLNSTGMVFIMKEVVYDSESMLETVEDKALLEKVYRVFKHNHRDVYEFKDN